MPTGVMICSVCMNNQETDIVFHVITDGSLTDAHRRDLKAILRAFVDKEIVFYTFDDNQKIETFPPGFYTLSTVTYYRLFIAEILSKYINKALYLDCDMIVRHSLMPLWNIDLEGYALGAVYDTYEDSSVYNRLEYPSTRGYFNAGMLLVNLDYWRKNRVIDDFMAFMQNHHEKIKWHDQDVLNTVFSDLKLLLPAKFNVQHSMLWKSPNDSFYTHKSEIEEALNDPVILHFTGEKPWKVYQRRPHPFSSSFLKYQNMTKWKGMKYENRSIKRQIKNFVGDILRTWHLKTPLKEFIDIAPID